MLRHFKIAGACLFLLFFSIPASAEFYQYVDSKGITHFTDNISTIPTRYQSQLTRHHETVTFPDENSQPAEEASEPGLAGSFLEADNVASIDRATVKPHDLVGLQKERNILLAKKESINKKYEMLMAEKQQLEKSKESMKDEAHIALYNKRVKKINEKIQRFKEEEKHFKLEIERFNDSIRLVETSVNHK